MTSGDYKFYYVGENEGPREFGTGFMVFGKFRNAVIGFNPVNERMCMYCTSKRKVFELDDIARMF